jgi:hypothetical protein
MKPNVRGLAPGCSLLRGLAGGLVPAWLYNLPSGYFPAK